MINMTAKEFLNRAYKIDYLIKCKIEQLEVLEAMTTKITSVLNDCWCEYTKDVHPMESVIIKMIDLELDITAEIEKLMQIKKDVSDAINDVENPEYRLILESRYISLKSWEQIAVDFGYSMQHIFRLHSGALNSVKF